MDADGHFQALSSNIVMRAGGKNNYSQFVAELAAYCAAGAYHIPRAVVDAIAEPSAGVVAGSMRGFGGPQAFLALETLVDQVARDRGIDAIELRHRNALRQSRGDHTVTGAPLIDPLPIAEICERAQQNPLWQNRSQEKAKRRADETLYGVGFALANQAFGTGADGVMAAIEVDREGRLTVISNAVDMGNGSATTLAITTAKHLGVNAADIRMGQADLFSANLKLSRSPTEAPIPHEHRKRSHVMFQNIIRDILHPSNDKWLNPHYTHSYSMSSSACITAFQQVHAVHQASLVFRDTAVWPAAAALRAVDANNQQLMQQIHWDQERLVLAGHPALSWPELAKQMWSANGVVAAMIHACFQAKSVTAAYPLTQQQVGYHAKPRWAIDGLALRQAKQPLDQYTQILRQDTDPPPPRSGRYGRSLYAPSATLAAVEVSRPSGVVKVLNLYTYFDAGTILQRDLVLGQYEGGAAMGIGYALLEDLPLTLDGAGTGRWNLNQYHVALAADVPVNNLQLELLTPRGEDAPAKGIAGAVLCPIAPAIANAIADATGFYITDLPITADKIQQRWRMSQ